MQEEAATVAHDEDSILHDEDRLPFRYLVGGQETDWQKQNRKERKSIEAQLRQFDKRYRNVRGPNGERPTLVIDRKLGLTRQAKVYLEFPEAMKDQIADSDKAVKVA
jgi:hypothetical protein